MNKEFVYYRQLQDGSLHLYGRENGCTEATKTAIYWDDFLAAIHKFGLQGFRPSPPDINTQHTPPRAIAEIERAYGVTVGHALSNLYGRRLEKPIHSDIVGRVISFDHGHREQTILVMGIVTAAFVASHRAFTSHVSYADWHNAGYYNTGNKLYARLSSDVRGLSLNENEEWFLLKFYQDLLSTY